MIRGVSSEELPNFNVVEYKSIDEVENIIQNFLTIIR
jgi:hypothetical protein